MAQNSQITLEGGVLVESKLLNFVTSYGEKCLSLEITDASLDLSSLIHNKVNNFNLNLPTEKTFTLDKIQGELMILKEGQAFRFDATFSNLLSPFPYLNKWVECESGHIAFQYTPAEKANNPPQSTNEENPSGTNPPTPVKKPKKQKQISLLAEAQFKFIGDLKDCLPDTQGLWMMTNDSTLVFVNLSGKLDLIKIINALFGTTLDWDPIQIKNAGLLQISTSQSGSDSLNNLKKAQTDSESQWPAQNPPLKYDPNIINLPKLLPIDDTVLGSDFQLVNGCCFWFDIQFEQFSLFNNLIKIGYNNHNSLALYGLSGLVKDAQGKEVKNKLFYAQLPEITLFDFLHLKGSDGRQGIQMKYDVSQKKLFELNGTIGLDIFSKAYNFDGQLTVNDDYYQGTLNSVDANQQISQPFYEAKTTAKGKADEGEATAGMTGIHLDNLKFSVKHQYVIKAQEGKKAQPATTDISLSCDVTILTLLFKGKLVFFDNSPQLALITLANDKPLSLTDMIVDVFGQSWHWMDGVTNNFKLSNGEMYYYKAPKTPKIDVNTPKTKPIYTPGYNISADLTIFDYVFIFDMSIEKKGIVLSAELSPSTPLDLDFVEFDTPKLSIDTTGSNNKFSFSSFIYFFGDKSISFSLVTNYQNKMFSGSVSHSPLTIGFQWAKSGNSSKFEITSIDGFPTNSLNLMKEMESTLNKLSSGSCAKIVKGIMKDLCKTKVRPSFIKAPTKKDGKMFFPIKLTYYMDFAGESTSESIDNIPLTFDIPSALSDLPEAVFDSIVSNAGSIAESMLDNPNTYKIITLEAAKKGLISVAARMLCKAIKKFAQEVLDDLMDGLADAAAGTLAETIELALAMTAAALAGIGAALSLLHKLWDWLTGKDDKKKKEAESKINKARDAIDKQMKILFDRVDTIQKYHITNFKVTIDKNQNFVAHWDKAANLLEDTTTSSNALSVDYTLSMLSGSPGDSSGTLWPNTDNITLKGIEKITYSTPLSSIPDFEDYRFNASLFCTLKGFVFADKAAQTTLQDKIDALKKADLGLAKQFGKDLQLKLDKLMVYNEGIKCAVVYDSMDMPPFFTIGQSRIGVNTRLES